MKAYVKDNGSIQLIAENGAENYLIAEYYKRGVELEEAWSHGSDMTIAFKRPEEAKGE